MPILQMKKYLQIGLLILLFPLLWWLCNSVFNDYSSKNNKKTNKLH